MALSPRVCTAVALCFLGAASPVVAAERNWYAAAGAGVSRLTPDASNSTVDVTDDQSVAASLWLGRDLSKRFSAELGLATLGEATLTGDQTITYAAASGGVIAYVLGNSRSIDNRDGFALYLRGGLSFIDNDSDVTLERADNTSLWAGAGVDWMFSRRFGLRAEVASYDGDAQAAYLGVIGRFRGARAPGGTARAPVQTPDTVRAPATQDTPATPAITPRPEPAPSSGTQPQRPLISPRPGQSDTPRLDIAGTDTPEASAQSVCVTPAPNEPVDAQGCARFSGVIAGVEFEGQTARLTRTAVVLLDRVAQELLVNSGIVVEIQSHTETLASAEAALALSRERAVAVARHLAGAGVPVSRLRARAFGDTRPRADNATAGGRRLNNRIALRVLP